MYLCEKVRDNSETFKLYRAQCSGGTPRLSEKSFDFVPNSNFSLL